MNLYRIQQQGRRYHFQHFLNMEPYGQQSVVNISFVLPLPVQFNKEFLLLEIPQKKQKNRKPTILFYIKKYCKDFMKLITINNIPQIKLMKDWKIKYKMVQQEKYQYSQINEYD